LRRVVDAYLETGRPVGSKAIAEGRGIEWGPSTVRAELAALEQAGYLTHPHTSAGRIPTDAGYRRYVDMLLESGPPPEPRALEVSLTMPPVAPRPERSKRSVPFAAAASAAEPQTAAPSPIPAAPIPSAQALGGDGATLAGRIHIGPEIDYLERAYDAAKYGDFSPHPWCEATIPTVTDASLAPDGKHVMSVLAQFAPYKLKGGWNGQREALGDAVVGALAAHAPGIESLIEARQVLTPEDLETTFGTTGGHVLHGEPALDQLFTMRPLLDWANYRTPIAGLYLCGSGTHPGGGVTGAPGQNASREVVKDLRAGAKARQRPEATRA